jgi:hypothetical protein
MEMTKIKSGIGMILIAAMLFALPPATSAPALAATDGGGIVSGLDTLANDFEQNLAEAQKIMDSGGFLAPIGAPNSNAIKIYNARDLDNVRNDLSGSYVLMNDIDLSGFNGGEWVPIGDGGSNVFSGTFDGQGHKIRNLKITANTYQYAGLFGVIIDGLIMNIGLIDTYINVFCTTSATAVSYAGGIVGYAIADSSTLTIKNCYSSGDILSSSRYFAASGGIAGMGYAYPLSLSTSTSPTLIIENCYNICDVFSSHYTGGIVGDALSTSATLAIRKCYNTGGISSSSSSNPSIAGGIVGRAHSNWYHSSHSTILTADCYNTGIIHSTSSYSASSYYAGGIIGLAVSSYSGILTAENCYNTGDIFSSGPFSAASSAYAGGIVGHANACATINECVVLCNTIVASGANTYSYIIGYSSSNGIMKINNGGKREITGDPVSDVDYY